MKFLTIFVITILQTDNLYYTIINILKFSNYGFQEFYS